MKIFLIFTLFFINFWIVSATTCNPNAGKNSEDYDIVFVWNVIKTDFIKDWYNSSYSYEIDATFQIDKVIKWDIKDTVVINSWEYSPWLWWLWNLVWQKIVYAYKSWDKYVSHYCIIKDYSWFIFILEYKVGIFLVILLFFILFRRKIQNYFF